LTSSRPSPETAELAAELATDRKAADVVILDLADLSAVTDYFVICTGRSDVHVQAICERVVQGMRERGIQPISTEGTEHGQWALLDFGDVVIHVFQDDVRRLYDLERLWIDAPRWTYHGGSAIEVSRA
jgi:ribosome-associated protein